MNIPKDLRYTKAHEWVRLEGDIGTVGITDFAQAQLSELTYVELPAPDDEFAAHDEAGVVESVKAASDVYAPASGKVVEVNEMLADHPELINSDPYGEGWMFKMKLDDPSVIGKLLDSDQYEEIAPDED